MSTIFIRKEWKSRGTTSNKMIQEITIVGKAPEISWVVKKTNKALAKFKMSGSGELNLKFEQLGAHWFIELNRLVQANLLEDILAEVCDHIYECGFAYQGQYSEETLEKIGNLLVERRVMMFQRVRGPGPGYSPGYDPPPLYEPPAPGSEGAL